MKEALYYNKLPDNSVQCRLCPNNCRIRIDCTGSCHSRKNLNGILYATNYAKTTSLSLDPIEKKPLYHYYPGSMILSLGANSCNLHCSFCQNYEISQSECHTHDISPEELLETLLKQDLHQVAFTYTEPFTWYEYMLDCAKLFKPHKIRIVLVTNGYINQEPLRDLLPYIDAMNIDLKSFRDEFYKNACQGKLQPVLDTICTVNGFCHIELTTLIIPGLNDGADELTNLVDFVAEVNKAIPLHFSRYYPRWKCAEPITPMETLQKAYSIAKAKLEYVYLGNIQPGDYYNTYCPDCSTLLIDRCSSHIQTDNLPEGKCLKCGKVIYGRF